MSLRGICLCMLDDETEVASHCISQSSGLLPSLTASSSSLDLLGK